MKKLALGLPALWAGLLCWQWAELWQSRTWLSVGVHVLLVAMYCILGINGLRETLRIGRHVRVSPFPFPVPDTWPGLADTINRAQRIAETEAETYGMALYFVDVDLTYGNGNAYGNRDEGDD